MVMVAEIRTGEEKEKLTNEDRNHFSLLFTSRSYHPVEK